MISISRPLSIATNLDVDTFENVDVVLHDLFVAAAAQRGELLVRGRVFRGCRLQGPAILLVSTGVTFDATNFGDGRGDIRNLLMRPVGDKAIGTIPMRDCQFIGCEFYGVGFTGTDEFLDQVAALTDKPKA